MKPRGRAAKTRAWPDSAPLAQQNLVVALEGGGFARVDVLGQRLFRIRYGRSRQWTESALNRYGILAAAFPAVAFEKTKAGGLCTLATRQARLTISRKNGAIALAGSAGGSPGSRPRPTATAAIASVSLWRSRNGSTAWAT